MHGNTDNIDSEISKKYGTNNIKFILNTGSVSSFNSSYSWYGELYAGSTIIGYRGTSINLANYRGKQISGKMLYQGDSGHGGVNAYLTLSNPV